MMSIRGIEQSGEGLSYQEKSIIVSLISSVILYSVFSLFTLQHYQSGSFSSSTFSIISVSIGGSEGIGVGRGEATDFDSATVFQFWGRAVLLLIGVQVVLAIIGQIVLSIIHTIAARKDDIPTFEDERDKLINLKATRNTFAVFGVGFMLSMIGLAIGMTPVLMPIIMIAFMMAAEIAGNLSKLYFYRRGY